MCRMGAKDERGLQQELVDSPRTPAIVLEAEVAAAMCTRRVLVAQAEAQELGGIVRDEGADRPLLAGIHRVLGPVVAETEEPLGELAVGEGPHVGADVETLTIA